MKHLLVLSTLATVALTACSGDKKQDAATTTEGATASTFYKGALPGGEFAGIDATLELTADSNCMMTYIYKGIDTKLVDKGKWTIQGDMLQTTFTEVAKLYKITGDSIVQLDDSGNPIEDGKLHSLHKQ